MTGLISTLHAGVTVLGSSGFLYSATVTVTAITAVFARTNARRSDARATLTILLCRRSSPQADGVTGNPQKISRRRRIGTDPYE